MEYHFITGGYAKPEEAGLCLFSFDPERGFSLQKAWNGLTNPSFVLKHPLLPVLYTVEETAPMGRVCAWEWQGDALRPLDSLRSGGADPCHLSLSADGKQLFVSNYTSGSLTVFLLNNQGQIAAMSDHRQHSGHGLHPLRQEGPHVHCALEADGLLYVCDLGKDRIEMYQNINGKLRPAGGVSLKSGSGPRHVAVHDKHPGHLYCVTELANSVCHLIRRGNTYEIAQEISTLLAGFAGENTGAALHFTQDGQYLLASNRGHDSIAVYPVNAEGNVSGPVISPCVAVPRDFAVYDDFVMVGSQTNDEIRAYRLDRSSLRLMDTGWTAKAKAPTCFVRVD